MRRPLVPPVVMFLLGIAAARLVALPAPFLFLGGFLAAGLALLSAAVRRPLVSTAFLLVLFLVLGAGRLEVELRLLPSHHIDRLPEEVLERPLLIEEIIASPSDPLAGDTRGIEGEAGRVRVLLDLRRIWLEGREIEVTGRARLTLLRPAIIPAYGDRIRGEVKLRRPRGYLNPAGFDYPLYPRTMGVALEGWAGEANALERRGTGEGSPPLTWAYALRDRMIRGVTQLLPPDQASLLVAVILGERSGIPRWLNEAFLGSGTYHIVAISGLNVSLLAGALFFIWWAPGWFRSFRADGCG